MDSRWKKNFPVITCVMCAVLLAGLGLVCLYSALRGSLVVPVNILNKQIALLAVAVGLMLAVAFVKEQFLRNVAYLGLGVALLGLVLVLIPGIGVKVNGASRWLSLGVSRFQFSEVAKVLFVIGFAHYLTTMQRHKKSWLLGFMVPACIIGVFVGLLILEPDFGTAFLFGAVGFTMLYLWGARLDALIGSMTLGVGAFLVLIYNDPIRWKRITSFLDIEGNKNDGAYQLYQGLLAYGSGGVGGLGIGNGRQKQAFLPEAHTDFIFPVIGEELGLFATCAIVVLFALLFFAIIRMIKNAPDMYWFLVMIGVAGFLVYQSIFNIGVVTGLLPTKGISLPFISYGGANLVSSFLMVGVLLCAWRNCDHSPVTKAREV